MSYPSSNSSRIAADNTVISVLNEIIRVVGLVPEDNMWLTVVQSKEAISAILAKEHNKRKAS